MRETVDESIWATSLPIQQRQISVSGTWLHDLHATIRLESDYAVVTLAWQFGGAASN